MHFCGRDSMASANNGRSPTGTTTDTSGERPRSKSNSSGSHKKSPSGRHSLSRLPFLTTAPDALPTSPSGDEKVPFPEVPSDGDDVSTPRTSTLSGVFDVQDKGRQRKGSLRKMALLGTGKARRDRVPGTDGLNSVRKSSKTAPLSPTKSPRKASASKNASIARAVDHQSSDSPFESSSGPKPLEFDTTRPEASYTLKSLKIPTGRSASTTDEDEVFTIPSTTGSLTIPTSKMSPSPSPPSSEFSMTNPFSIRSRTAPAKALSTSPLAIPAPLDAVGEWDYSATEWWGWFILLATWLVFVVGMGSCLEVWSWAWDVGETPYAPPELQDDPTLPIVGYYPALIILTAVVSWVWVIVAWMGMKYFKHARTHELEAS